MRPTVEILEKINQNSNKNNEEIFTRLFRYLLREDVYYKAYQKLYANKGASTKGVDNDTADGFGQLKIERIIEALKNGTYIPKPVRRTYIAKNGNCTKLRPLGLPTFTDKLVQEVIRMVLESIYEPLFADSSHGFRPKRSCHTALKSMRYGFSGIKWFIEGDIKGCFDNINHKKLLEILGRKIKDNRFLQLINQFLKAGYLEEWVYHSTHSGTPQGGIISPILANIYLNELDKFVETTLKDKYHNPMKKSTHPEYKRLDGMRYRAIKRIGELEGEKRQEAVDELHEIQKQKLKLPSKVDEGQRLLYVRYADDFIIGVDGSRELCEEIKSAIKVFIKDELKMELSGEKTLITHSSEQARFLGYDLRVRRNNKIRKDHNGNKKRTLSKHLEYAIPFEKIDKFMFSKGIVEMKNGIPFPVKRKSLLRLTDLEVITTFNSELRGICNYYNLSANYHLLKFFRYCMEYSCLKTLCAKYKCSIGKIKTKFRDGRGKWAVPYDTKSGKKKMYLVTLNDCKSQMAQDILPKVEVWNKRTTTTLESRLKAKECEVCGATDSENYEIHHINKVKNLKGKSHWERIMIAKRRKTIVVCHSCHINIHHKN
ncbi:MAG: reverse transcriptase domain-containing protein [Firmicutes bacterium]|nr:reverse transcriptase domain-containing protein [Bacillota bacterium]